MKQVISQLQKQGERQQRRTSWLLLFVLFSTTLIISFGVHDSALLKPPILFIGVLLLLVLYLWTSLQNSNIEFTVTRLHVFFTLYLIASYVSLTQAINIQRGFHEVLFQVSYFAVFVFAFHINNSKGQHRFFQNAIIGLALAVSVAGLIEAISPSAFDLLDIDSDRPVFSTFGNATYFAGFIVMLVPLLLSQIFTSEKSSTKQSLLIVLVLAMFYLLILTETRTSWISVVVSILFFVFLQFKSTKVRWSVVLGIVAAAIIAGLLFPQIIQRRLGEISQFTIPSTLKERFIFYEAAWKGFLSSPLLGHGVGNTVVSIPFFRNPDYWMTGAEDIVTHIHNEYLQVLFETGTIGFVAWCGIFVVYFVAMKKSISSSTAAERTLLVGYVSAVAGFFVDNLTSMNFRVPPDALFFWFIIGISSSQIQMSSRKFSLKLPAILSPLRWGAIVGIGVFLYFYIPKIQNLYNGDENFSKGLRLNKQNDPSSQKFFLEAIKSDPNHEQARFFLALNQVQSKSFADAKSNLDTLLSQYPAYPKARLLLGLSLYDLGDTVRAFAEAEKDIGFATYPQTYHYICVLAYRSQFADVEYNYTKIRLQKNILSKRPDYAEEAVLRLGYLGQGRDDVDTCRSMILQGARIFNDSPKFSLTASDALLRLNYSKDAQNLLKTVETDVRRDSVLLRKYNSLIAKINRN